MISGRPVLGLTMGDPAGIGPEIVAGALDARGALPPFDPIVFGDALCMNRAAEQIGSSLRFSERPGLGEIGVRSSGVEVRDVRPGRLSAAGGACGVASVIGAARAALAGEIDAVVTAPLNKEAMQLSGCPYPGHTELLAAETGAQTFGMLLVSGALRVIHVSTHVALREAIDRVRTARVVECILLGARGCRELGIANPRAAIAGLNPHAGEHGLFGTEDEAEILPAVVRAKSLGVDAVGPLPPDSVFARAAAGDYDVVVAMYHDQGHIPIKLNGIDSGVNITVGLPIVRTSVDHGTAFDIAGTGRARPESMMQAISTACRIVDYRMRGTR